MKKEDAIKKLKQMISLNQFIIINQPTDVKANKDLNNEIKAMNYVLNLIEILETNKKELLEKLEERRKQNNNRYGQAIDSDEFPEMYEYSGMVQEDDYILSILKGAKNGI